MWLAVNIGNTNLKLGVVGGGAITGARRAATRTEATSDELEALLEGLLALDARRLADVDGFLVASVVPPVDAALTALAERRGIPLIAATADTLPMRVAVDHPREVGADRLVNAFAAARIYGAPAVVVDFGTATTLDVVAADGAYVGGAIAVGLELGLAALAERTARLPRVELREPQAAIGRNTLDAMRSGAVFGHLGLTRELLRRTREELGGAGGIAVRTVLTGGLSAAPWWEQLEGVDAVDPDLTLKGLALLHAELTAGVVR